MGALCVPYARLSRWSRTTFPGMQCGAGRTADEKDCYPASAEDGAKPLDFISHRPAVGAPEARPAPHCAAHTKRKGPGEAAFSRIPAAAAAALLFSGSLCYLLFASGNMVSAGHSA